MAILAVMNFSGKCNKCFYGDKKSFMALFCGCGSIPSRLQRHYEEAVYFLPLRSQEFLVLIWSISEGWKAESTLQPPSAFEHWTPGLGI